MKITRFIVAISLAAVAPVHQAAAQAPALNFPNPRPMLEIRSYNLKPGTRNEFHSLMLEKSMPLLKKWNMEVVAFGPSLLDENSYFLIRAFQDIADLQKQEDAFYGSDDWRKGPREAILRLIDSYTTIVMPDDAREAVSGKLQQGHPGAGESDRDQLSALNAQFIRNFINNDTVRHNEIVHRDFVYISSTGKIIGREEYMKNWAHGFDKTSDKIEYANESIRIFGAMALIRCNTTYSERANGKTTQGKTVYTDTYVKENGRWWCVQAQITEQK